MELELGLDPDDAARLPRLTLLGPLKTARARSRALHIVWHDGPDRELARDGLALAERGRGNWQLERLHPDGAPWPPGGPAPVVATAPQPRAIAHDLPDALVVVAAFDGRAITLNLATQLGAVTLTLLNGTVRAVAGEQRISRVRLEGPAQAVQDLAMTMAGELGLAVPAASLTAEALAVASGRPPAPRRDGAPELPADLSVPEAFAHVVGHLSDVILYLAPAAAEGQDGPEPVHQMRVAVRRLRSAIKVFRRAVGCPEVAAVDAGLKALAAKLAPTRDWDVFVTETAAKVADSFAGDKRLQRLLAAAERHRRSCHADLRLYLGSTEFRRLGIELACLAGSRDWLAGLDAAELGIPVREFAGRTMGKRLKRLLHVDGKLADLEPAALHAIRLRAKRLRYATEIFAPLYPGKATSRYIRRLSRLQDRLGALNDGAVAASLLAELTGGGGSHAFAAGLVIGFSGARNRGVRDQIETAWEKFERVTPFWE